MKILALNPPFLANYSRDSRSPAVSKSGTLYYPMWLSYAAGYLETLGHELLLIDATGEGLPGEDVSRRIIEFSPALIFLNVTTGSSRVDYEYAGHLKGLLKGPVHINAVGTHVSAVPEDALSEGNGIDSVCRQEFEHTLGELTEFLSGKREIGTIKGLVYRENGQIKDNGERPLPKNLDDFPWVSKTYKKFLNYQKYFYSHSRWPIVVLITGRGCPHQCIYCVYPQTFSGRGYRLRSIQDVTEEFMFIQKEFPDAKEIMIEDDTLTINPRHTREFCETLIRKGSKILWSCNSRADVDYETLKIMKKAGCRLMCVGVESGVQEILDNMKKKLKVEQIRQFAKDAFRAGIMVHGCYILGNPGETKETLEITLSLAKDLNTDTAQFFPLMVYPGTAAYDWAKKEGFLAIQNFSDWIAAQGLLIKSWWHFATGPAGNIIFARGIFFIRQSRCFGCRAS
jgi:radical SAM superfamily enzyme YgiQ (UPF0313 family)